MKSFAVIATFCMIGLFVNKNSYCQQLANSVKADSTSKADTLKVLQLDDIVVAATKTPKDINRAPASMALVTAKDIQTRGVTSVDEALKYESGVYNNRSKGLAESMPGDVMRGFAGTDEVLILYNGQPANNGYVGRPQLNNIPVEEIQKIEVVKGPFSSLYGGNAMGGVINIITKVPDTTGFDFKSLYGTNNTSTIYAGYHDKILKNTGLSLSLTHDYTDGYATYAALKTPTTTATVKGELVKGNDLTHDNVTNALKIISGDQGKNGAENTSVNTNLNFQLTEKQTLVLSAMFGKYHYFSTPGKSYLTDSTGKTIDTGTVTIKGPGDTLKTFKISQYDLLSGEGQQGCNYYSAQYSNKVSTMVRLNASAGLTQNYENWYTTPGATATKGDGIGTINTTPNMKGNVDLQSEFVEIVPRNTVVSGVSFEATQSKTESFNLPNWKDPDTKTDRTYESQGKSANGALFLQDEFKFLDSGATPISATMYAGGRLDYWRTMHGDANDYAGKVFQTYPTRSEISFSPKLSLVGTYKFLTLRGSVGTAFKPPTNYDLYRTWKSSTGWLYLSNPDLKPEHTTAWEIGGVANLFAGKFVLRSTGFQNFVTNLLYTTTLTNLTNTSQKENAGKARIQGIENDFTYTPFTMVSFNGSYTYTDAYIVENSSNPLSQWKRLTLVPENVAGAGVTLHVKKITWFVGGRFVSKRYSKDDNSDTINNVYNSYDPFTTFDTRLAYQAFKHMSIGVQIDNLLDEQHFDYYKAPGRTISAEAKVSF